MYKNYLNNVEKICGLWVIDQGCTSTAWTNN